MQLLSVHFPRTRKQRDMPCALEKLCQHIGRVSNTPIFQHILVSRMTADPGGIHSKYTASYPCILGTIEPLHGPLCSRFFMLVKASDQFTPITRPNVSHECS